MLPKPYRLQKTKEINNVFKNGFLQKADFIFLKSAKNNLRHPRFAVVVSTKIDKKATVRNRIKRRLTEIIRSKLPKITYGYDVLLIPKKEIIKRDYKEVEQSLDSLFKKINLL